MNWGIYAWVFRGSVLMVWILGVCWRVLKAVVRSCIVCVCFILDLRSICPVCYRPRAIPCVLRDNPEPYCRNLRAISRQYSHTYEANALLQRGHFSFWGWRISHALDEEFQILGNQLGDLQPEKCVGALFHAHSKYYQMGIVGNWRGPFENTHTLIALKSQVIVKTYLCMRRHLWGEISTHTSVLEHIHTCISEEKPILKQKLLWKIFVWAIRTTHAKMKHFGACAHKTMDI